MSFLCKLKDKVITIQNWYKPIFEEYKKLENDCPVLTNKEEEMYRSAARWHLNSHYRLEFILYRVCIRILGCNPYSPCQGV